MAELTYTEVGATRGDLPAGYHHLRRSRVVGHGRRDFVPSTERAEARARRTASA